MELYNHSTPKFCAGCFQQQPWLRHVDYKTDFDGPVLPGKNGDPQPIDDLILCESCVRGGAVLVGMTDDDAQKQALVRAVGELEELKADVDRKDRYILALEDAVSDRPGIDKRPSGRPSKVRVAA